MSAKPDRYRRLLRAQLSMEAQATSQLNAAMNQLRAVEEQLNRAQQAISGSSETMIFSDLYLGHVGKLLKMRVGAQESVEAAKKNVLTQRLRSQTLDKKARKEQLQEERQMQESNLYELLDRGFAGTTS